MPRLNQSESTARHWLTGILSEAAMAIWNINELILHCTASQSDAKTSHSAINHPLSDSLVLTGHCLILSAMEKGRQIGLHCAGKKKEKGKKKSVCSCSV